MDYISDYEPRFAYDTLVNEANHIAKKKGYELIPSAEEYFERKIVESNRKKPVDSYIG
jgi:hypothetical protein